MRHFFAYLHRMKYILRWNLMKNTSSENLQEHSLQVAVLAHALALIANRLYGGTVDPEQTATIALFHETSETITGDLVSPIKYFNPEIRDAYQKIEHVAKQRLLNMLPNELKDDYRGILFPNARSEEYRLVKAADKIGAYIKCLEEIRAGNSEFSRAKVKIERDIEALDCAPADYFMRTFVPSYDLTLDELN